MALVNVHPDYLQFPGEAPGAMTYPVEHFIRFLEHARNRHAGAYWQALPREVARAVAPYRPCHEIPVSRGRSLAAPADKCEEPPTPAPVPIRAAWKLVVSQILHIW